MACWATIGTLRLAQISALSGAYVGDRVVRLQRAVAGEREGELGVDRLRASSGGTTIGSWAALQLRQHGGVGLVVHGARAPGHVERPDRVDALAERLAAHRHTVLDRRDVGDARHRPTAAALLTDSTVPLIVGGRRTIVGLASGTCRSIAELLAAGDDVERVDAVLRRAEDA